MVHAAGGLQPFKEKKGEVGAWLRLAMEKKERDMEQAGQNWLPTTKDPPPVVHSRRSPVVQAPQKKQRVKRKFAQAWDQVRLPLSRFL